MVRNKENLTDARNPEAKKRILQPMTLKDKAQGKQTNKQTNKRCLSISKGHGIEINK